MSFKLPLKLKDIVKKSKGKNILIEWGWTKQIAHNESYGKIDNEKKHNIIEYHISG